MTSRGRRALVALAGLAAALFAGRWITGFLVESWWAAAASPAGAVFAVRWSLLRLGLEVGAIGIGTAWFAGCLLLAARFGGRAAVLNPPSGGAVEPRFLRWWALGISLLLGVLCGAGSGAWAPEVALALEGPRFGLLDTHLGRDIGFFLGTLPALLLLQQFLLALAILGFVATTMLYAVAGALRVTSRTFSLEPAIRMHLGFLGALLALLFGAGYLLEPLELAAGLRPSMSDAHLVLLISLARGMAGFSLAVAILTMVWGLRGRMMLPVGGWASYALFAVAIRLLAPSAGAAAGGGEAGQAQRELEREAFAIPDLVEESGSAPGHPALDQVEFSLWDPDLIPAGPAAWLGADWLPGAAGAARSPNLLLVGAVIEPPGAAAFVVPTALVTAAGGPLTLRPGSSEPLPGVGPLREIPAAIALPGARQVQVGNDNGGVVAGGLLRRLALTWALQEGVLGVDPADRVNWRLDPGERLRAVAPFVEWGAPRPRLLDSTLVWVAEGYLHGSAFPGVAPTPWRGRSVSYLRAAFLGVVTARHGEVRVFERGRADPISSAWTAIARGLVEPAGAIPTALVEQLPYPAELFAIQGRVLHRPHWGIGGSEVAERPDPLPGPVRQLAFVPADGRRVAALLQGERRSGADHLRLLRFDPDSSLDRPGLLAERWQRLPYVGQMTDSVRASGARLSFGPVHLMPTREGLVAYQAGHAVDSAGRATLALVNVAFGSRLGTGPRADAAWRNLRGEVAALPVSIGAAGQLREARQWLLRADSAFRKGDLAAFGRAFEALRAILDNPPGPAK